MQPDKQPAELPREALKFHAGIDKLRAEDADKLESELAERTRERDEAVRWQWRFSDKLIQEQRGELFNEQCHSWDELFAEVVKQAAEITRLQSELAAAKKETREKVCEATHELYCDFDAAANKLMDNPGKSQGNQVASEWIWQFLTEVAPRWKCQLAEQAAEITRLQSELDDQAPSSLAPDRMSEPRIPT